MKLLKNQRGEVVTAVMVLVMVGVMIFGGMALRHGDNNSHAAHCMAEQQNHSGPDHQHMHGSNNGQIQQQNEEDAK